MTSWMVETGPQGDVAISSRIRLARNWKDIPFPSRMQDGHVKTCIQRAKNTLATGKNALSFIPLADFDDNAKMVLLERHAMSPELHARSAHSALLQSKDERVSVMVLEEDHLRIQCFASGLQLKPAYEMADKLDQKLCPEGLVAFDDTLGYLTACPTNVGTGMRASVMLHLPALTLSGQLAGLIKAMGKIGLTVRGLYGEGSEASADLYQISNQITLGHSEEEIIAALEHAIEEVIRLERQGRVSLKNGNRLLLEDSLMRAVGILGSARLLSMKEFMGLWTKAMLAQSLGYFNPKDESGLRRLLLDVQPASLQLTEGRMMEEIERDSRRAEIVRKVLFA